MQKHFWQKDFASCSTWHHMKTHEFLKMHAIHLICVYANTSQRVLYYRSSINLTELYTNERCAEKSSSIVPWLGSSHTLYLFQFLCMCCSHTRMAKYLHAIRLLHTNNMLQMFHSSNIHLNNAIIVYFAHLSSFSLYCAFIYSLALSALPISPSLFLLFFSSLNQEMENILISNCIVCMNKYTSNESIIFRSAYDFIIKCFDTNLWAKYKIVTRFRNKDTQWPCKWLNCIGDDIAF